MSHREGVARCQRQARHWETWIAVKRAVDGADADALLAMECPNDQYDDAVAYLAERRVRSQSFSVDGFTAWFRDCYGSEPDGDAVRQILDSLDGFNSPDL